MGNEYHIDGIYNLTLVRNNSHVRKLNFKEDNYVFFMLDYFNFLRVKKLEDDKDGYKMLCGIDDREDMAAARKIMGIYALVQEGETVKDLFQCSSLNAKETSDTPFLGVVQLNIIDDKLGNAGEIRFDETEIRFDETEKRLLEYREKIEDSLKNKLGEEGDFQIFQTITSEDFCVVIRTSKVRKIYEAVTGLMEIKNKDRKRVFFTYTNVGIECMQEKAAADFAGNFICLSEKAVQENAEIQFEIRFRMENSVLNEMKKMMEENDGQEGGKGKVDCRIEGVKGMFGRYDLVARINIREFQKIYPYLCRNKSGYSIKISDSFVSDSLFVRKIMEGMRDGTIKALNVRVLMDLKGILGQESSTVLPWLDRSKAEKIEQRSKNIQQQFENFQKEYGNRFVFNRYRYLDLCSMMERLMSSYKNLAYELDTHTNWYICNEYLKIFFENMNYYMNEVDENDEKAKDKFMNEFQAFINAFGEFVRILQDNNQHTIQAPRYDVVAPIDGQKFLLAYGEYMDYMHEQYCGIDWAAGGDAVCKENRRKARVIIYPDVSRERIEVMEVIQFDTCVKKENREKVTSLLLCSIPMFEYFERTYDIIPLISHEICHQMLVLKRDERNGFLIKMLFQEISKIICYYIYAKSCDEKYVVEYDSITELLSRCLADVLEKNYKEDNAQKEDYVSNHISISVYSYMKKIMREEERDERLGVGNILWENIVKHFYDIAKEIYAMDEEFLSAMEECEKSKDRGGAEHDKAVQKVYEFLLQKVNGVLPRESKKITKKDLKDRTYVMLDDFLVKWYKDYMPENEVDVPKKQKLKHYIDLIKRLQAVYHDALCWKNSIDRDCLNKILSEFSKDAEKRFRDEFLQGDKFCIYSRDQMMKVAYLELLSAERARGNLAEIWLGISLKDIHKVIDHTVTLYRESCADMLMCKWLGFDSFGYFRVAVTFSERMANYWEEISDTGLFRRRLISVLAVLMKNEQIKEEKMVVREGITVFPCNILWKKITAYIHAELSQAKERTWERMRKDYDGMPENFDKPQKSDIPEEAKKAAEIHEKFFKVFETQMEAVITNVSEGKSPVWEGAIWEDMTKKESRFFGEDALNLRSVFQKEINLYRRNFLMLHAFWHITVNGCLQAETELIEHLEQVYDGMDCPKPHKIVKKVVDFYNNPKSGHISNYEKMKDMLRFMQDYYYYNRFKKMKEEAL